MRPIWLVVVGCSAPPQPIANRSTAPPTAPCPERVGSKASLFMLATDSIPDVEDRCSILPASCFGDFERDDGCPDVDLAIELAPGSTALSEQATRLLDELAIDAERLRPRMQLVILGDAAPARTVFEALVTRCVPHHRMRVAEVPGVHRVVIRVAGCD